MKKKNFFAHNLKKPGKNVAAAQGYYLQESPCLESIGEAYIKLKVRN